ncbi:MAG: histidinol-phosphate transaminase [Bacteroidia bacterium]|nr:histidinol-phosphate transaminase [Bacteroidia bacterium]
MKELKQLVRRTIWELKPYSSARDEYSGCEASVFLDANENPYNAPYNRYPDPLQRELKGVIGPIKGVSEEQIFLGNGSDEAIDLLFRVFCEPGVDEVVAVEPTYGMYQVCAAVNGVAYRQVWLNDAFQLDASKVLAATTERTKLVFICSPNNPTGNDLDRREIERVIAGFEGVVVLDEAYGDFSEVPSFCAELGRYPNLVVLQTFSKAWGCAGIRLGMALASSAVIALLNKVKYPYNINVLTQQKALEHLRRRDEVGEWATVLKRERELLCKALEGLGCVKRVYPSAANFLLVQVTDATRIYQGLVRCGVIVRNRDSVPGCSGCLRISVGTSEENEKLIEALRTVCRDV